MSKCSFCSGDIQKGKGKMFVRNDGKVFHYCSRKCERSMNMGRNPVNVGWIRKKKKSKKK